MKTASAAKIITGPKIARATQPSVTSMIRLKSCARGVHALSGEGTINAWRPLVCSESEYAYRMMRGGANAT
jgi:hypothetical protein